MLLKAITSQDFPDFRTVNKIYAEGNFGDSMLKVGRYGEFSSYGRIIDTEISGAEYTFEAGDLSGALTYGRLKDSRTLAGTTFENPKDTKETFGAYLGTEYSSAREAEELPDDYSG